MKVITSFHHRSRWNDVKEIIVEAHIVEFMFISYSEIKVWHDKRQDVVVAQNTVASLT